MKMIAHQNIGEELDVGKAEMVRELGEKRSQSASSWKIVARPFPRLVT